MEPTTLFFGGAITATLPGHWLDASDARPVPDHQEVWLECDSDRSLIVELLERVECADAECAATHFEDVASGNGALHASVLTTSELLPQSLQPSMRSTVASCFMVHGVQTLPPAAALDTAATVELHVCLAVLRLAAQTTDLVLSVSRPHTSGTQRQAAGDDGRDNQLLLAVAGSVEVHDWNLFGQQS